MAMLLFSFVLMLVLSFAVALYFMRPPTAGKGVVKRLNVIHRPRSSVEVEMIELNQKQRGWAETLTERLTRFQFSSHLSLLILYSGRTESVGFICMVSLACGVILGVLASLLAGPLLITAAAATLGGCLPYLWLQKTKNTRVTKFSEALPDAIELMSRALRAGHSSASSIEIIAEQSPKPLSGEFERCFQQQKFGIPFRDALLELGYRIPSKDLQFLITAILVQKETGGDLTQILDRATTVIRERIRIEGEVRSYTAQGRLTGWILAALPIVMLVLINLMTPGYTHVLFVDPLGQKLLYAGAGLMFTGAMIIRKIVDVKV